MNSYQTLNAAARISGIAVRHAVAFGQAWQQGKSFDSSHPVRSALQHALVGNLPRTEVGRWNAEDKARQLAQRVGPEPATIPRREYGAHPMKFLVVQTTFRGEDVYYVARHTDLKRVTFYTTLYENATWWAEIRNSGDVTRNEPTSTAEVIREPMYRAS